MKRALLFCATAILASGAAASGQDLFDLQKIADGVYAAIAQPRTPINCNAAVIVYDEGVLVVDTHSRPSSATALIQQIQTVTDKPVRYAVNTHFHWDHAQGNHAYPVAFPKPGGDRGVRGDAREPDPDGDEAREGPDRRGTRPGRGARRSGLPRRRTPRPGPGSRTSSGSRRSISPRSAAWS